MPHETQSAYTPEQQEEKIRGLRERIAQHERETDQMREAGVAWQTHAEKLEKALEVISITYRCHHPREAGHAMDVVEHLARSASDLTRPGNMPGGEFPF